MRRILFLVDRTGLGEQTKGEFESFVTPDDRRTFTGLYPTARLTPPVLPAPPTDVAGDS